MRIALYEPAGPRSGPYPFGNSRATELTALALERTGHQVDRVTAADAETVASSRPKPDVWISSGIDHESGDHPGRAVCAALGIPHVLLHPELGRSDATTLQAIAAANATFVPSAAQAAAIAARLPPNAGEVVPLRPFIDLDTTLRPSADRRRRRARLAVELNLDDVPWLIVAGPMATDRDLESHRHLAQCMTLLAALKWRLIVVGVGSRLAEVGEILGRIPGRNHRIVTIETPAELLSIVACGDLFIVPSTDERLSLAAIDAQAVGVPVVAGGSAAMQDIVANGRTGMLTKPGNTAFLGNAVGFLLRHPDFRRTYADQGREWSRNFGMHAAASTLDATLRRVVRPAGAGDAAPPIRPVD